MNYSPVAASNSTTVAPLDGYVKTFFDAWDFMSIYFLYPLWPIAVTFNVIIIIIFCSTSLGTTKTTRMYYASIAANEIALMMSKDLFYFMFGYGFYAVGFDKLISGGVDRWSVENLIGCKFIMFFWFFPEAYANFIYVILGAERVVALYWPMQSRQLITKKSMTVILAGVGLFLVIYYCLLFYSERLQYSPYYLRGVSCFMGGLSEPLYLSVTTLLFSVDLLVPTPATAILSIFIAVKVRNALKSKLSVKDDKAMTQKQIEFFITPVIMSSIHLIFYVPLAVLRIAAIVLPYIVNLTKQQSLIVLALGFIWHVAVMPVHCMNFTIYCFRVPGFWNNVKLILKCNCREMVQNNAKQ